MRSEAVKMNIYKLRKIMDCIRNQGKLPTDQFGQILPVNDLIGWFGLSECLTIDEQSYIEIELKGIIEAELAVEKIKRSRQDYSVTP